MKKLLKSLGCMALVFAMIITVIPAIKVKAGGTAAGIFVMYAVIDEQGRLDTLDDEEVQGLIQTIEGPESGETFWFDGYQTYCMFIKPTAGTYTVTEYGMPEGYELDEYGVSVYPMEVTITDQDVADYKAWAESGEEAGTEGYTIYIPVKKKGEKALYMSKPSAPTVKQYSDDSLYFYSYGGPDREFGSMTYEIRYSTSKTGKYTVLKKNFENNDLFFKYFKKLKNNTTYYFRIRAIKKIGKEKIVGAWTKKIKIKVIK